MSPKKKKSLHVDKILDLSSREHAYKILLIFLKEHIVCCHVEFL